jgi:hypothetical protein
VIFRSLLDKQYFPGILPVGPVNTKNTQQNSVETRCEQALEQDDLWQAFASTGNIYRYLDYKQAAQQSYAGFVGENTDGDCSNTGLGSAGDPL